MRRFVAPLWMAFLLLPMTGAVAETIEVSDRVVVLAAAVAQTDDGLVGTTATVTVTAATNGSGHIFLDTFPLAEVDMQGSARLAVRVASQLTGIPWRERDFFFVVRSGGPLIGGPSAGATLTVGAAAAMAGWKVRDDVVMTGTVNPDGSVGPVGGIAEKAEGAAKVGRTTFLFPAGQLAVPYRNGTVNVTEFCATQLRITCIPVSDVIQAVGIMTDHVIDRPPVPTNVTDEAYRRIVAPVSAELLHNASVLLEEAQLAVATIAPTDAAQWNARLLAARATFARAQSAATNGTYYTAASLSFQTSIEGHMVRDVSRLLNASDKPAEMERLISRAEADVAEARQAVEGARVTHAAHVETVGSAQVRLMEAEERVVRARGLSDAPRSAQDLIDAVYEASYASERAKTAQWWLRLRDLSQPGAPLDEGEVTTAAHETVAAAREIVAYIEAVLIAAGRPAGGGESILDADQAIARGFSSAAILHALEAEVRAASTLEASSYADGIPEVKFIAVQEEAARAIEAARARGVEPLLAQSQYEFGSTLENGLDRLTFLGLSRVTANLAGLPDLAESSTPGASRFQGLPPAVRAPAAWVPAAFAVGLALGVGAGLTALMPKKEEDEIPKV